MPRNNEVSEAADQIKCVKKLQKKTHLNIAAPTKRLSPISNGNRLNTSDCSPTILLFVVCCYCGGTRKKKNALLVKGPDEGRATPAGAARLFEFQKNSSQTSCRQRLP